MKPSDNSRINPQFVQLCRARIDVVAALLDVVEAGVRYPSLWRANHDLECLAGWVYDIPELKKRVEDLGERYSKIAFSPAPGCPQKYLPRPRVVPSIRAGRTTDPITDEEARSMVEALYADDIVDFDDRPSGAWGPSLIIIGRRGYRVGRLRRALDSGLISGGPARQFEELLHVILLASAKHGISTSGLRRLAEGLSTAFPRDSKSTERRFATIRRRLIKERVLRRCGRSRWQRDVPADDPRIVSALELLDRLEQEGSRIVPTGRRDCQQGEEQQ